MLHKIKSIDFSHETMADLGSSFKFPQMNTKKFTFHKLPTEDEVGDKFFLNIKEFMAENFAGCNAWDVRHGQFYGARVFFVNI